MVYKGVKATWGDLRLPHAVLVLEAGLVEGEALKGVFRDTGKAPSPKSRMPQTFCFATKYVLRSKTSLVTKRQPLKRFARSKICVQTHDFLAFPV